MESARRFYQEGNRSIGEFEIVPQSVIVESLRSRFADLPFLEGDRPWQNDRHSGVVTNHQEPTSTIDTVSC
jgi:hypothetical protein